jgi:hypothetical protein
MRVSEFYLNLGQNSSSSFLPCVYLGCDLFFLFLLLPRIFGYIILDTPYRYHI